ncbi:MAG: hypothetical protein KDK48_05160, partial [Chlamydiia bacterium]|nr:hypothetical protein [Chlamydiia bacterium]
KGWTLEPAPPHEDLSDTRKPLCVLKSGSIVIYVHNFPYDSLDERIPPEAQIARWERQSGKALEVKKIQSGGYYGLQILAPGVLARAMQLDAEQFQHLIIGSEKRFLRQMRADYTLKAVGPADEIEQMYDEIHRLFDSFELQQELPGRR